MQSAFLMLLPLFRLSMCRRCQQLSEESEALAEHAERPALPNAGWVVVASFPIVLCNTAVKWRSCCL